MKLTLIRHGKANDTLSNIKDFDRELTEQGEIELINNIENNITALQSIDLIICSWSKRTRQTCELLCDFITIENNNIIYDDNLYMFENRYDAFIDYLYEYKHKNHICFIGHDYWLSDFAIYLSDNNLRLKTGEIMHISYNL